MKHTDTTSWSAQEVQRASQPIPRWLRALDDDFSTKEYYENRAGTERRIPDDEELRDSAVLVLITGDKDFTPTAQQPYPPDASILITHRRTTLRGHSGEMAFPGGRRDPDDPTAQDTAYREALEETGLDTEQLTPLAVWPQLYIPVTGFAVSPVVAYHPDQLPVRCASPVEVDWVDYAKIEELLSQDNYVELQSAQYSGPGFWIEDYLCWGFTAKVLDIVFDYCGWLPQQTGKFQPRKVDLFEALDRAANHVLNEDDTRE